MQQNKSFILIVPFEGNKVVFDLCEEKKGTKMCLFFHVQQMRGSQAMHRIGVHFYNILWWIRAISRGE